MYDKTMDNSTEWSHQLGGWWVRLYIKQRKVVSCSIVCCYDRIPQAESFIGKRVCLAQGSEVWEVQDGVVTYGA
jgi:hypothetical protein